MMVIVRRTLNDYVAGRCRHRDHKALKGALDAWFHEVQAQSWQSMAEVKAAFGSASVLNAERVVFNIKGNDYRLVTAMDFRRQCVFIKWIGTHEAYDEIDAKTIQYTR